MLNSDTHITHNNLLKSILLSISLSITVSLVFVTLQSTIYSPPPASTLSTFFVNLFYCHHSPSSFLQYSLLLPMPTHLTLHSSALSALSSPDPPPTLCLRTLRPLRSFSSLSLSSRFSPLSLQPLTLFVLSALSSPSPHPPLSPICLHTHRSLQPFSILSTPFLLPLHPSLTPLPSFSPLSTPRLCSLHPPPSIHSLIFLSTQPLPSPSTS